MNSQEENRTMGETAHVTGRQIAAARALANLDQETIAKAANISVGTLRRMEATEGAPASGYPNNVAAVIAALEKAGVEFTNSDQPGVRLRKSSGGSIPGEQLNAANDD
jgi:DNA-binding transcriptional regulator YiaG